MGYYDPKFGDLLTSKETAELTGFTMNQLRNFRQRGNSPIHFLSDGNTSWYRKQDVMTYIQQNGVKKLEYHTTGSYEPAPVSEIDVSPERREHFAAMAKITSYNSFAREETLAQSGFGSYGEGANFMATEGYRLYELATGEDLSELFAPDSAAYNMSRKTMPQIFWPIQVYGVRAGARKVYGWDVSDQDIINAPVGEVPPTKQGN
jgi:hypothetical protein